MIFKRILRKPTATVREGQTLREALHKMVSEDVGTLAVLGRNGETIGALHQRALKSQNLDQVITPNHFVGAGRVVYMNQQSPALPDEDTMRWIGRKPVPVACTHTREFLGLLYPSDFKRVSKGEPIKHKADDDFVFAPIHDG